MQYDWHAIRPALLVLLALMAMDVAMGLLCAFATKKVSSTTSWAGMCKKAGTLLIVVACTLAEPFVSNIGIGTLLSAFYCVTEFISVLENAARLGVPLPAGLIEALEKLRSTKVPVTTLDGGRREGDHPTSEGANP